MCCPFFFHLFSQQSNNSTKHTHNTPSLCHLGSAYYYSMYSCFCLFYYYHTVLLLRLFSVVFLQEGKQKSELFFLIFYIWNDPVGLYSGPIGVLFCFVCVRADLVGSAVLYSTGNASSHDIPAGHCYYVPLRRVWGLWMRGGGDPSEKTGGTFVSRALERTPLLQSTAQAAAAKIKWFF
jgi:hypothetical protein